MWVSQIVVSVSGSSVSSGPTVFRCIDSRNIASP